MIIEKMDKKEKINGVIKLNESETVEFKTGLSEWKESVKTLAAFSWINGGIIIFGVSPTREVIGLKIGKGTIEELANNIKQNTDPKLYPSIKVSKIGGKDMIIVEIKKTSNEPVLAFGRAYQRVGKSTHQLSREEYKRIIRDLYEQEFDGQLCEGASLEDIDRNFVEKVFILKYESLTNNKLSSDSKNLLENLGCIKKNKPTNAGILLFGKEPQKFFMNAYVALARYKDDIESSKRLDYKEFNGNLFQQIDKCNSYINDHLVVMSRLEPGKIRREDIPEYGLFSIRELITNAICHRDYSEQWSKVIVKMFDGRVDYYNPGGFGGGVTPKTVVYRQYSRNPIIARVLSKVEYIEELGEGWNKIIKEHKDHSLKPKLPKIIADKSSVLISLFSTKEKFEEMKEMLVLNERQKKIMKFIEENGRITTSLCANLLNVSADTALRELIKLKSLDLIKIKGVGRDIHYVVK